MIDPTHLTVLVVREHLTLVVLRSTRHIISRVPQSVVPPSPSSQDPRLHYYEVTAGQHHSESHPRNTRQQDSRRRGRAPSVADGSDSADLSCDFLAVLSLVQQPLPPNLATTTNHLHKSVNGSCQLRVTGHSGIEARRETSSQHQAAGQPPLRPCASIVGDGNRLVGWLPAVYCWLLARSLLCDLFCVYSTAAVGPNSNLYIWTITAAAAVSYTVGTQTGLLFIYLSLPPHPAGHTLQDCQRSRRR